jgi:hypothetical protein
MSPHAEFAVDGQDRIMRDALAAGLPRRFHFDNWIDSLGRLDAEPYSPWGVFIDKARVKWAGLPIASVRAFAARVAPIGFAWSDHRPGREDEPLAHQAHWLTITAIMVDGPTWRGPGPGEKENKVAS